MKRRMKFTGLAAALLLSLGIAQAQEPKQEDIPVVPVNGMKKPEMREYRSVWAGLEAFDEKHSLAPAASLHFRMWPKRRNKGATIDDVTLKIVGDGDPIMVPIAADGLLTMPRSQAAYDSKAILLLNRKRGLYEAMPDIRTPGLPDNVRRLGDLRLECNVMVAIAKDEIGFFARNAISAILLTGDWCSFKEMRLPIRTAKPVVSAMLVHGDRRAEADLEGDVAEVTVPLGDKTWPDDTVIELKFAE
jgi:hypothetical protein